MKWLLRMALVAGLLAALTQTVAVGAGLSGDTLITFSALERSTGVQGVYLAFADGTGVRRITPNDGRFYNWPQFAFGGSKIVYTVRSGPEGSPEDLYMMNSDGSDPQLLQQFEYRIGQPKVSPDGTWLVFTAQTPWFTDVALFRFDLRTFQSVNLSAVTSPLGAIDADPMIIDGGQRIVFAESADQHTRIMTIASDGTDRRPVTDDRFFNTDPDVSPDGKLVVNASFQGEGNPGTPGKLSLIGVSAKDWRLMVTNRTGGDERMLTAGQYCLDRPATNPCRPEETSAYKPRWSPDGTSIGFNAPLDSAHTCICAIDPDGSNPRVVLSPDGLAIDWFDWVVPTRAPGEPVTVGDQQPGTRLVVVDQGRDGATAMYTASPDLMHRQAVSLPTGLKPLTARWAGSGRIVFTAKVPVPSSGSPHPAPPAGVARREHYTLSQFDPLALALSNPPDASAAQEQVFLREADGTVRQLTDPWIEDWQDGVRDGDVRANTDPVVSPDGRYVVFTNVSTLTGESFLLRLDLTTGDVLNLTNATAGALATDDHQATFSPDGSLIAFIWSDGTQADVYVMDAATGATVRAVTEESGTPSSPAFAPDGQSITYVSARTGGVTLVRVPLAGGAESVMVPMSPLPLFRPVVSPTNSRVLFLGFALTGTAVFTVKPDGTGRAQLQPEPLRNALSVDERK